MVRHDAERRCEVDFDVAVTGLGVVKWRDLFRMNVRDGECDRLVTTVDPLSTVSWIDEYGLLCWNEPSARGGWSCLDVGEVAQIRMLCGGRWLLVYACENNVCVWKSVSLNLRRVCGRSHDDAVDQHGGVSVSLVSDCVGDVEQLPPSARAYVSEWHMVVVYDDRMRRILVPDTATGSFAADARSAFEEHSCGNVCVAYGAQGSFFIFPDMSEGSCSLRVFRPQAAGMMPVASMQSRRFERVECGLGYVVARSEIDRATVLRLSDLRTWDLGQTPIAWGGCIEPIVCDVQRSDVQFCEETRDEERYHWIRLPYRSECLVRPVAEGTSTSWLLSCPETN